MKVLSHFVWRVLPRFLILTRSIQFQAILSLAALPSTSGILNLPIFGNQYLITEYKYPTDSRAGLRNRGQYARQFGPGGEDLIEQLGRGHHPGHGLHEGQHRGRSRGGRL